MLGAEAALLPGGVVVEAVGDETVVVEIRLGNSNAVATEEE